MRPPDELPPDKRIGPDRNPGRDQPPQTTTASLQAHGEVAGELRRWAGCPCGCRRTPWFDDPDCITQRPVPEPHGWPVSSVEILGLIPHNKATCSSCRAVTS